MIPTARIGRGPSYRVRSASTGIVPATSLPFSAFCISDDSMFQQIMQMHDPDNSLGTVHDNERRDGIALHHFDCLGCQLIWPDHLGVARGQSPRSDLREIATFLEKSSEVAVGNDPEKRPGSINYRGHAEFFSRHFENGLGGEDCLFDLWHLLPLVHEVPHFDQQPTSKRSTWMKLRKILFLESTLLEQCNGQGIPHRKRHSRTRRRS